MQDDSGKLGLTLEAVRMDADYIALRKGADQDRELEIITGNIRKASQAGVKIITYHWTVIPIRRNRQTPGRGRSTYAGFKLEDRWQDLPTGKAGRVSAEDYWERIEYFLKTVIPVATEHDVKMACHPYDPPGLPFGYQGADNWDSPSVFAAIKRYESLADTPYNGFQLCLGTACHVRGGEFIVDQIGRVLGIKPGENSADMQFTLEAVNCVGCCSLGPVMVVDGKYYGNMAVSKVERVLKNYKELEVVADD